MNNINMNFGGRTDLMLSNEKLMQDPETKKNAIFDKFKAGGLKYSNSEGLMKKRTPLAQHKSRMSVQHHAYSHDDSEIDTKKKKKPLMFNFGGVVSNLGKIDENEKESERTMRVSRLDKSKERLVKSRSASPVGPVLKSPPSKKVPGLDFKGGDGGELGKRFDKLYEMIEGKVGKIERNVEKMKTENQKQFKEINRKLLDLYDTNF